MDCSGKAYQNDNSKPWVLPDSGNKELSLQSFTRGKEMGSGHLFWLPYIWTMHGNLSPGIK